VAFSDSAVGPLQIASIAPLMLTHVAPAITTNTLGFFGKTKPGLGWPRPLLATSTRGGDQVFFEGPNNCVEIV